MSQASAPSIEASAPSIDDWRCPVCLEMLCKPVVGACGHVFCFWCEHKSMDVFDKSSCPTCRMPFSNLPAVCEALHYHLGRTYPREYARRLRECHEEEKKTGNFSPNPTPVFLFDFSKINEVIERGVQNRGSEKRLFDFLEAQEPMTEPDMNAIFACTPGMEDVETHVLWEPVVLNCGHAVCKSCASSTLTFGPGSTSLCPCGDCRMRVVGDKMPAVCKLMQRVIEASPIAERVRREAAAREEAARLNAETELAEKEEEDHDDEEEEDHDGEEEEEEEEEEAEEANPLPGAVPEGGEADVDVDDLRPNPETFVHVAVGCDACGVYPIKGRRFRCIDCPERMGFDLCGACHGLVEARFVERGPMLGAIEGRFNQQHRPGHRMREVLPVPNFFHILQQRHPDLNPRQIMNFIEEQILAQQEGWDGNPINNAADNIVADILDNLDDFRVDGAVAAEEGTAGGNIMEAGLEGGPVEDVVRADAEAEELLTRQLFGDEDEEEEEEEEEGDVEVEYLSEEDEELASDARRIGLDAS